MRKYKVKLIKKEEVSKDAYSFYFEKPDGFKFKAGQYISLSLIDPKYSDLRGNSRSFSVASAPNEKKLMITLRMSQSGFKRTLRELPIKSDVLIEGPQGEFILSEKSTRMAILIAMGIGITPMRSIILEQIYLKTKRNIKLIYLNQNLEQIVFLDQLRKLSTDSHRFELSLISKKFNQKRLETEILNINHPIFYIAGSSKRVWEMYKILQKMGVGFKDIVVDEFTGY